MYADLSLEDLDTSNVSIITAPKPDIVVVNSKDKHVTLPELSVPFKTNTESTHQLKVNRYRHLKITLRKMGLM